MSDLLGGGSDEGQRLEGFIDPLAQVAIDEQLLTQQGSEIGQALAEAGAQLQVFK